MEINSIYHVLNHEDTRFLANIENGDVYEINDVTLSILEQCSSVNNVKELTEKVYSIYQDTSGDYSKEALYSFIEELVKMGVLIIH